MSGPSARVLGLLGAYAFGWAIAFGASALGELLTSAAMLGSVDGHEAGPLPRWLPRGAAWLAMATLGAYLIAIVGGRRAFILGVAAAAGGLCALFVPLLLYAFPARVFTALGFEALVLGAWLPAMAFALSRRRR